MFLVLKVMIKNKFENQNLIMNCLYLRFIHNYTYIRYRQLLILNRRKYMLNSWEMKIVR